MPMKINVGLAKKIGQVNYGSLAANCGIEFQADRSILQNESLRRQVQRAYAACCQAVNDELARQQGEANGNGSERPACFAAQPGIHPNQWERQRALRW